MNHDLGLKISAGRGKERRVRPSLKPLKQDISSCLIHSCIELASQLQVSWGFF